MGLDGEIKGSRGSHLSFQTIVVFGKSLGNIRVGQVGHGDHELVDGLLRCCKFIIQRLDGVCNFAHLLDAFIGILA